MKKSSAVNLTIVCCLLTLCIGTLLVIYATAPETAVVLLEENFNALDESRWTHEAAECQGDSEHFYYTAASDENRYSADGALHFFTTHGEDDRKSKRDTQSTCNNCINWPNGAVDCFSSKYSARLRTKAAFQVTCGELEIRLRFPSEHWIKVAVLIVAAKNETEAEETLGGFVVSRTNEEAGANCSAEIQVSFGAGSNESAIQSAVADDDFHTYKIEWDHSKIIFAVDQRIVLEKVFGSQGNNSCSDTRPDQAAPINQAFHIKMGVDLGGDDLKCRGNHSDHKRSLPRSLRSSALEVDRIRFSELLREGACERGVSLAPPSKRAILESRFVTDHPESKLEAITINVGSGAVPDVAIQSLTEDWRTRGTKF